MPVKFRYVGVEGTVRVKDPTKSIIGMDVFIESNQIRILVALVFKLSVGMGGRIANLIVFFPVAVRS